ncbi:helix-turn-helix transcriptional regulator [Mesorhizobium sp.]|uniref:helix-turn-helix domain-containing protein n=1 Tax=Mesorhizobium sp. TaxID=1871066 RepID=UPI000FE7DFFE|nr:helix-turn-helix transcriptional regulator [Mesorhizobium sp.]RWM45556.1 MAG: XRE family transcriptional regulator [Mesorhizobium sp.]RWM58121.1 MAG: XRE family transcriptional regulator [Mesorhizobium sp.]RWM58712.1 MAG: XRE family transcriptional regulator [Mesorhizobium sp.]TIO65292.1 MAG: helix-turn-helix transcriptional regulator [Mesorhizobium sp.]TJV88834.1 MAG: helix-turn-helix transcriptional regulator [Mesorhizobium sp.]
MTDKPAGFSKPPAEPDRQTLSERLRVAREYVGLKQEDVARHLSIPRSALSHIEAGQRKVDALELARMAKLYQRPVNWFTGEDDTSANLPKEVAHVARAAASLSSQDRQELARFADFLKSRAKAKVASGG